MTKRVTLTDLDLAEYASLFLPTRVDRLRAVELRPTSPLLVAPRAYQRLVVMLRLVVVVAVMALPCWPAAVVTLSLLSSSVVMTR